MESHVCLEFAVFAAATKDGDSEFNQLFSCTAYGVEED